MTTGRINQIARFTPARTARRMRATPRGPAAPTEERQDVNELSWKGRNERPATAVTPQRTGGPRRDHPIAPTESPSGTGPHAEDPAGERPHRRRRAAAYGPQEGGPDPVDNADERRIPRGGSPRESRYRDWPAANDPQTPTVPGTQRSPGFGHRSARRGPNPGMIKPVKAARAGPQRDCGGRLPPFPGRGPRTQREPNAPPVTERQPAWQGRRRNRPQ